MDDVHLHRARSWLQEGESVAVATIMHIEGSSNQPLGSRMYVAAGRAFTGSVSGGCVEADISRVAEQVCSERKAQLLHYGPVDDPVFEVGLNCDGEIWVLVEPADEALLSLIADSTPGTLITRYAAGCTAAERIREYDEAPGPTGGSEDAHLAAEARRNEYPVSQLSSNGSTVALVEPILPPPELIIFGATEVAATLARFAREVGFRVVVTDPRASFATAENHPDADLVVAAWPSELFQRLELTERSYIVSLNHEPRFEDALFKVLAESEIQPAYLGAIGKRTRHHERIRRAQAAGTDIGRLPRIHTPVGLDIGGKAPAEVALSIAAELVSVRYGRSGGTYVSRYRQLGSDAIELESVDPRF